jgi:hypothetical protein
MAKFKFAGPPEGDDADALAGCERQLRPLIQEIVQAAAAVGWNEQDVLLSLMELSWDLYEVLPVSSR